MPRMTIRRAMQHPDELGAGAAKRRKLTTAGEKVHAVMGEFSRGTLHSGSGQIVTNRDQAVAIAMSEARRRKKRAEEMMGKGAHASPKHR